MPTAEIDKVVRFLQYLFVDGKFYTIFSLLFGIGFSIIISNAAKKGNGRIPYILSADDCSGHHRFSAFDVYLERRHLAVVCLIGHAAPSFPACFGQSVAGDFRSPIATSYSD